MKLEYERRYAMHNHNLNHEESGSILAQLRRTIPQRPLHFDEALRIAELQASRLLELTGVTAAAIPSEVIGELPRLHIERRAIPTSGLSYWNGQVWVIGLNRTEPWTRQRFTLFHEYKHIIDHGSRDWLYRDGDNYTAGQRAEQAADYFAGCALMPRRLLKRAWASGMQHPDTLGRLFEVSTRAVTVRLAQIGLTEPTPRCTPRTDYGSRQRPSTYFRRSSPTRSDPTPLELAA
jgi:IrrE N-terminal-like domain